jgi:hypothetical protein
MTTRQPGAQPGNRPLNTRPLDIKSNSSCESKAKLTGGEPAKHTKYAHTKYASMRSLHAEASVLWMPAAPMTNSLVSRLSFFVRRLSSVVRHLSSVIHRPTSVVHIIRSSSFRDYFLLKNTKH